jgi:hypothetical protein
MKLRNVVSIAAAVGALGLASAASATTTTWTFTGNSKSDGPVNATATFTTSLNSLTIDLTDLLVNPTSDGQLISGLSFMLDTGGPATATLGTTTGALINIDKKTGVATSTAVAIDHWAVAISGGKVFLEAAGGFAPGGKPHDLIIGPGNGSGVYTNANSSISDKNPSIKNTGHFTVNFTGVFSPFNVKNVQIAFGTSGTDFHTAWCSSGDCFGDGGRGGGIPEPATWAMMILGFGGVGAVLRRRRKAALA